MGVLRKSFTTVAAYVQRGPEGMSWLCFVGGLVTCAFGLMGLLNIFDVVFEPLYYVVNLYQLFFGLATCILEAPKEWVRTSYKLQDFQSTIHEYAKFLSTFGGRGLFYLFQGSLAISLTGVSPQFLLGWYMFGTGLLCIAAQYKIIPEDIDFRQAGLSGVGAGGGMGGSQAAAPYVRLAPEP